MKDFFERTEKKYMLNASQYEKLSKELYKHLHEDKYGWQKIMNIYFDTDDFGLIRHSLEKPLYKEKLRLRCYNVPTLDDKVYFEIKKKYDGVVYKRRMTMALKDAYACIEKGSVDGDGITEREITNFIKHYKPAPKYVICYDRLAMYEENGTLRLTIDTDIRSRDCDLRLENGDYGEKLTDKKMYVVEIKTLGGMPCWLADALNQNQIYPTSFSKYGRIYQKKKFNQVI